VLCSSLPWRRQPSRTRAVAQQGGHRELSLVSEKSTPCGGAMTSGSLTAAPERPVSVHLYPPHSTCRLWHPDPAAL
jgi:hypothetical protein